MKNYIYLFGHFVWASIKPNENAHKSVDEQAIKPLRDLLKRQQPRPGVSIHLFIGGFQATCS